MRNPGVTADSHAWCDATLGMPSAGARWKASRIVAAFLVFTAAAFPAHGAQEATPPTTEDKAASSDKGDAAENPAAESKPASKDEAAVPTIPVAASEPTSPNADEPTNLDNIVVTSTKREVSVREIPATLTVLPGEQLEGMGAQRLEDYIALVPGVSVTEDGLNPKRVTIRGISADIGSNFTTGVLIGDVPFSDLFLPRVALDMNPFDLATVEVLKGPQGTLFGGSGLNGAVRYVPQPPQFEQTALKAFAQYLDYGKVGGGAPVYGAMINVPYADQGLALRLVGFSRKSPGYIDVLQAGVHIPDVNTTEQTGLRAILGWQPSDRWDISLLQMMQNTHVPDYGFADNMDGRLERRDTPQPSPTDTRFDITSLGITFHLDWADLVSETSRLDKTFFALLDASYSANGGQAPVLQVILPSDSTGRVQEFRLVSKGDGPWKYLVGAFGHEVRQKECFNAVADSPQPLPPDPSSVPCPGHEGIPGNKIGRVESDITTQELALFGETSLEFFKHFEVTLGARLYRMENGGLIETAGPYYAPSNQGLQSKQREPSMREHGRNPKVTLSYRFSNDLLTYLSASRGFRFGGVNVLSSNTDTVPPYFRSDHLWNYELGVRSQWFGSQLLADASVYYIDWKDPQLYERSDKDPTAAWFNNVSGARSRGAETALRWYVPWLPGITLSTSAAYSNTVTTAPFTTLSGTATQPGTKWPLAPDWQTSTTLAYQTLLGSWNIAPSLVHTYSSKAFTSLDHDTEVYGYQTLDLRLGVNTIQSSWIPAFSFDVNNLTDKRGITNLVANKTLGYVHPTYLPPRSVMVRLETKF